MLTERLTLEPLLPQHAPLLFAALADPTLYAFVDAKPPASVEALSDLYKRWSRRRSPDGSEVWLNWAARLCDSTDYVGWFQATAHEDDAAEIAYLVFGTNQKQGFAREACAAMIGHLRAAYGVLTIRATIDYRNMPSIRLAEALGLELVGRDGDDLRYSRNVAPR